MNNNLMMFLFSKKTKQNLFNSNFKMKYYRGFRLFREKDYGLNRLLVPFVRFYLTFLGGSFENYYAQKHSINQERVEILESE